MYGRETTRQIQPGRWWVCADPMDGAGQSGVSETVTPGEIPAAGDRETVPRGRQRPHGRHFGISQSTWLVVIRHHPASQAGVAGCRPYLRNGEGAQAESRELVRADLACAGQTRWVRRRSLERVRSKCVSKNAALTPGDGVERAPIAPGDGVERGSPTPGDGAIEAIFAPLSTPPDGDPLEKPSTQAIYRKEAQQ